MEEPLALGGLLLLPLIGGFLLADLLHYTRYYYKEIEGHRIFFVSGAFAAGLLGISRILIVVAKSIDLQGVEYLRCKIYKYAPIPYFVTFLGAFLLGPLIAMAFNTLVVRSPEWSRRLLLTSLEKEDSFHYFLFKSQFAGANVILFQLTNELAFIGFIFHLSAPGENAYVSILPIVRLRRTPEGMRPEWKYPSWQLFVENQQKTLDGAHEEDLRFELVLKRSEILSAEHADDYLSLLRKAEVAVLFDGLGQPLTARTISC
jgi:hypothetical protein